MLRPMGCAATLRAHDGCVNRLAWSEDGAVLASVSDDTRLVLWRAACTPGASPWAREAAHVVPTRHRGNMFGVAFLPLTDARQLVTSAMDGQIRWLEQTPSGWEVRLVAQTGGSVNAVAVGDAPHTAYAACETGQVLAVDTRTLRALAEPPPRSRGGGDLSNCRTLLSLQAGPAHRGGGALQATSVAVSAANPHMLAVGASDQYVRLYDTRALPPAGGGGGGARSSRSDGVALHFCPLHLAPDSTGPPRLRRRNRRLRHVPGGVHTTHVEFDASGRWLAAAISGDANYVFDTRECEAPVRVGDSDNVIHWAGDQRAELGCAATRTPPPSATRASAKEEAVAPGVGGLPPPPHGPHHQRPRTPPSGRPAAPAGGVTSGPGTAAAAATAAATAAAAAADAACRAGKFTRAVRLYAGAISAAETAAASSSPLGGPATAAHQPPPRSESSSESSPSAAPATRRLGGLLTARAAALLQRGAPGDASDAVADCVRALQLAAPEHALSVVARSRLAVALHGAGHVCAALRVADELLQLSGGGGGPPATSSAPQSSSSAPPSSSHSSTTGPPLPQSSGWADEDEAAAAAHALEEARALAARLRGELAEELVEEASQDATRAAASEARLQARRTAAAAAAATADAGGQRPQSAGPGAPEGGPLGASDEAAGVGDGGTAVGSRRAWVRRAPAVDGRPAPPGPADDDDDDDDDDEGGGGDVVTSALAGAAPRGGTSGGGPSLASGGTASPTATARSSSGCSVLAHRNAGRGYPAAFFDDASGGGGGGGGAADADSDDATAAADPDPQLLCTRHALRCAGGRNLATGIKEVAFWDGSGADALRELSAPHVLARQLGGARDGGDGVGGHHPRGFMVAGCDSGHVLVFDRATGLLVAALPDDPNVTNCVRPHATLPVLAAGGIAHTVRVWAPTPPEAEGEADEMEGVGALPRGALLRRRGALPREEERDDDAEEEEEEEEATAGARGSSGGGGGGGGGGDSSHWQPVLCAPGDQDELDELATRQMLRPRVGGSGYMLGAAELAELLALMRGEQRRGGGGGGGGGRGGSDGDGGDDDGGSDGGGGGGPRAVRCAQQ